jgi:hypothetical protein
MTISNQALLLVFVCVDALREQRVQNPVVEKATMPLRLAGADAGDADQAPNTLLIHRRQQHACRVREQVV